MQSVIIIGKDNEKVRQAAKKIISENKISRFDAEFLQTEKAVGIADIRGLQQKIILKPIHGIQKAIILEAFLGITPEAQNAFLKILEEPPASTILIILATSLDFFLPTILSRCNVIYNEKIKTLTKEDEAIGLKTIEELKKQGVSYALKVSQDNGKTREEALNFLENLIIVSEDNLDKDSSLFAILKKMQATYTIIKTTNASPRLCLENLFLNLFIKMI